MSSAVTGKEPPYRLHSPMGWTEHMEGLMGATFSTRPAPGHRPRPSAKSHVPSFQGASCSRAPQPSVSLSMATDRGLPRVPAKMQIPGPAPDPWAQNPQSGPWKLLYKTAQTGAWGRGADVSRALGLALISGNAGRTPSIVQLGWNPTGSRKAHTHRFTLLHTSPTGRKSLPPGALP